MALTSIGDRPIPFSGPLVGRVRSGAKTATRRLVSPQPSRSHYLQPMWGVSPDGSAFGEPNLWREVGPDYPGGPEDDRRCPFGVPGDHLWIREGLVERDGIVCYGSDLAPALRGGLPVAWPWKLPHLTSRYMPRWARRLRRAVTRVRVQRLRDIDEAGAVDEGFGLDAPPDLRHPSTSARDAFLAYWDFLHGEQCSARNPFVWAIDFRTFSLLDAPEASS